MKLVLIVCLAILLSAALRYASGASLTQASSSSERFSTELVQERAEAQEQTEAQELTETLIQLSAQYQHVDENRRNSLLLDLERVAAERQEVLSTLIATDPQAVLSLALPAHLRESLPESVQSYVEQEADLVGDLEVLFEDSNGSLPLYFLNTKTERLPIYFANDPPPQSLAGSHVRARGIVFEYYTATTDGIVFERSLVLSSGSSLKKIKGIVFE